jgi:hypothetical protein
MAPVTRNNSAGQPNFHAIVLKFQPVCTAKPTAGRPKHNTNKNATKQFVDERYAAQ